MQKIGRNDPCACGSGKKYKACCGKQGGDSVQSQGAGKASVPKAFQAALEHHRSGRLAQAIGAYEEILRLDPKHAEALHLLGTLYQDQGRLDDAIACYQKAVLIQQKSAEIYSNLGNALQMRGQPEDAAANCRKAIALKPAFPEAHSNLGNALMSQGKLDEAIKCFRQAIRFKPDFATAYRNLGVALNALGKFEEALPNHRQALVIKPDYAEVHSNLGVTLEALGHLDEAVASYRQALKFLPNFADAHNNLGNVLRMQGRHDEALASYRDAILFNPQHAQAYNNLGSALQTSGQFDDAVQRFRKAIAINPDFNEAYSNLLFCQLHQSHISLDAYRADQKTFAARFEAPLRAGWQPHANNPDPARQLKVGFVSGDLRNHAVAKFIEHIWAALAPADFALYAYSTHPTDDAVTLRLREHVQQWRSVCALGDAALAEQIRADEIDILIDLSGHTSNNRLLTFARKPAPVQITYLGFPGSSALQAMDYRLTDSHADPIGNEAWYQEKLLRLPDSLWCYKASAGMPDVNALPALSNGYLTFGSLNNANKLDEATLALWGQLLRTVPDSCLLLATVPEGRSREQLTRKFTEQDIDAARLTFAGPLPNEAFYRLFHRVDIALDPLTMNGATTTCEGLWMGVPTLSLVGQRFGMRAGLSLLSAAGLPEFAVTSADDYLKLAQHYAADLEQLSQLRSTLRDRVARSPLTDAARFAGNLAEMLRLCWHKWVATQRDSLTNEA